MLLSLDFPRDGEVLEPYPVSRIPYHPEARLFNDLNCLNVLNGLN